MIHVSTEIQNFCTGKQIDKPGLINSNVQQIVAINNNHPYSSHLIWLTIGVFVWFSIAGWIILDDGSVDAISQTFVHVDRYLIGHSDKEIHKESTLPKGRDNIQNFFELAGSGVLMDDTQQMLPMLGRNSNTRSKTMIMKDLYLIYNMKINVLICIWLI